MQANGKDFVARVDKLLVEQKKTKEQLKKNCGLSKNAFDCWKARGTIPAADIVYKISVCLDTSIEYLLFGQEDNLSFNTKKLLNDFLSLSDKDQIEVANIIAMKKAMQQMEEKKDIG